MRYPDIFVLSLSEVFPVDFASHKLKIDADVVLPKKLYQRPMTLPMIWRQQGSTRQYPWMP